MSTFRNRSRWFCAALCALAALASLPARAQITFVGAGAQVARDTAGTITPVLPAGTAAGDFAVLVVVGRPTDTTQPAVPGGRCAARCCARLAPTT